MIELERWGRLKTLRDPVQGQHLTKWFENVVKPSFSGRVLMIDWQIASICADLHVPNPKPEHDALIAATAMAHQLILVTRNTQDFQNIHDLNLLNPFSS
ncbi:Predicted nucleic acid-binding protein, contains PIN domain [Alysiella filiformis DSM 16848]|uniref:Predicted nucleic acid-binding protein, contains PIN domain n=2 Tax=Alysiella TaxID=194195 RepID=A0A286E3Z0_9NEIS|nr:Predicted nucleic acid-binding protein, contains PIN domain [Alysiella filiformis DSM 16848]